MQYVDARESVKGSKRIAEQGLQVVCAYQFSTDILTLDLLCCWCPGQGDCVSVSLHVIVGWERSGGRGGGRGH